MRERLNYLLLFIIHYKCQVILNTEGGQGAVYTLNTGKFKSIIMFIDDLVKTISEAALSWRTCC